MTFNWKITIEAWPHSIGGQSQAETQVACGGRIHTFKHFCSDFSEAFEAATLLSKGMLTNPVMWQAPIVSIQRMPHGD